MNSLTFNQKLKSDWIWIFFNVTIPTIYFFNIFEILRKRFNGKTKSIVFCIFQKEATEKKNKHFFIKIKIDRSKPNQQRKNTNPKTNELKKKRKSFVSYMCLRNFRTSNSNRKFQFWICVFFCSSLTNWIELVYENTTTYLLALVKNKFEHSKYVYESQILGHIGKNR